MAKLNEMTEAELRDYKPGFPDTEADMLAIIRPLIDRPHDYGTCVYAMSIAAEAAFSYVAHKLGVTGFQASCADMDFIARTRSMKDGFRLLNHSDLLYPQYRDKFDGISFDGLISENAEHLKKRASELLAESSPETHPEVRAHWERLSALTVNKEPS